jgi:nitrate/nitrite transporter NarK
MKAEGKSSKAPLTESFARWPNLKIVLLALFGLTAGQAVVWYTGQFYTLFFLTQTLKVDAQTANLLLAGALLLGTPFFLVFGSLSDRIGRKPIIMAGLALSALTYFPIFRALTHYANPALEAAETSAPVVVAADKASCSVQFDPVGKSKFTSPCDVAKAALVKRGVPYNNEDAPAGSGTQIRVGSTVIPSYDAAGPDAKAQGAAFDKALASSLDAARYPKAADKAMMNKPMVLFLLWILVIYVTLVYAPIAAMLVEMFPTRIRYTSMSLPYHIGNGWFGGFLPPIAFAIVAAKGNIYSGLWYPVIVSIITLVIGLLFVKETNNVNIESDTLAQEGALLV